MRGDASRSSMWRRAMVSMVSPFCGRRVSAGKRRWPRTHEADSFLCPRRRCCCLVVALPMDPTPRDELLVSRVRGDKTRDAKGRRYWARFLGQNRPIPFDAVYSASKSAVKVVKIALWLLPARNRADGSDVFSLLFQESQPFRRQPVLVQTRHGAATSSTILSSRVRPA